MVGSSRRTRNIMSNSTPCKPTSGQITPGLTSNDARRQEPLKESMEDEIGEHTFSFPPHILAQILSPKTPKPRIDTAGKLLELHEYDCVVDEQPFQSALNDAVARLGIFTPQAPGSAETASYPSLAKFLTKCVKSCHDALDKQAGFPPRQQRWYRELEFIAGRLLGDGADHAKPLFPDIVGGKGILPLAKETLYWKSPPEKSAHRVMLPVEVKKNWRNLVSQAATYARCLFDANPMRTFALVLGFNQERNTLRFLVFHHGGLTASEECNIADHVGLREATRLFLTLASWGTAEEAGFITCCSDSTYLLPKDKKGSNHVSTAVERELFRSLCVRGRMTLVSRLRLPTGDPAASTPLSTAPTPPLTLVGFPYRRSQRIQEKVSGGSGHAGRSGGSGSRGLAPSRSTTTSTKQRLYAVPEQKSSQFFPKQVIQELANNPVDGPAQVDSSVQLKYIQPEEIIRSEDDPTLSELTGTIVVKTSWPGTDRRTNKADMYRDSGGRFGTIPHVCSYEAVGRHREVISNILFVPQDADIKDRHWQIFKETPPSKPEVRTLRFSVFSAEGKVSVDATSPRQLSRSWAHSQLGMSVGTLQISSN